MKLRAIKIYGLFNEFDYEVQLSDECVTYLHSPNGYGKSTLMKLIANVMKGELEEVKDVPFERLDLFFDDEICLIVENEDGELLIQMQKNEMEEELTIDELISICNVLYIPPERTVICTKDEYIPAYRVYGYEITSLVKAALDDCKLITPSREGRIVYSDDELEFHCKDLKAKLDFIKQVGMEPEMPPGYRFPPSRFEIMEYREDYIDLTYAVDDYVEKHYSLAESIIVFMDIVNNVYLNKTLNMDSNGNLGVTMDNSGTAIELTKLSSGERQIMIMVYQILFNAAPGSLVIIDEPEISLHISWQQQLGKIFTDLARLRDLRMLVATHSPSVIHNDWDNAAELVKKDA